MAPMAEFTKADTCSRCGIRRLTLELKQLGIVVRLCDDCYWGNESQEPAQNERAADQDYGGRRRSP